MDLKTRIRHAIRAFKGNDVCTDQGLQVTANDGTVHTLAKLPVAGWVRTEDPDVAHGALADRIEECFGTIDWDEAGRTRENIGKAKRDGVELQRG